MGLSERFRKLWPAQRVPAIGKSPRASFIVQSAAALLQRPEAAHWVNLIEREVGANPQTWRALYRPLLEHFAAWVQALPASESHHHARPWGLLDHSLEVCAYAVQLVRTDPSCLERDKAAHRINGDQLVYAVATAALLHDAGKLLSDQRVQNLQGSRSVEWNPWGRPLSEGRYRVAFRRDRRYAIHEPLGLFLASRIVPPAGLAWIAAESAVLSAWTTAFLGRERGSPIAAIVTRADQRSVGACRRDQRRSNALPSLAELAVETIRSMYEQGDLILNRPGAVGWADGSYLWLVAKTAADRIRDVLSGDDQHSVPKGNGPVFDALQTTGWAIPFDERAVKLCQVVDDNGWQQNLTLLRLPVARLWPDTGDRPPLFRGTIMPLKRGDGGKLAQRANVLTPTQPPDADSGSKISSDNALGQAFLDWLRTGLATGRLKHNESDAAVHRVNEGAFIVSPKVFKLFVDNDVTGRHSHGAERNGEDEFLDVQSAFQQLGLHRSTKAGTNIWTCRVRLGKSNKNLRGYWLPRGETLWGAGLAPPNNPHLRLEGD